MVLIFGGAYQGKLSYALSHFGLSESDVYTCGDDDTAIPGGKRIIYKLDRWILALVSAELDVSAAVGELIGRSNVAVIISDDISCGVVPADPTLRKWREETGRALGLIANNSDRVVRLFCGIPTQLKPI